MYYYGSTKFYTGTGLRKTLIANKIAEEILEEVKNIIDVYTEKAPSTLKQAVNEIEILMIKSALSKHSGNQVKAAESLELNESTLRFKMKKHGISGEYTKKDIKEKIK